MSELTTEMVRIGHVTSAESDAKFARWIARVKAQALRDAAMDGSYEVTTAEGYKDRVVASAWLYAQADLIELDARRRASPGKDSSAKPTSERA